MRWKSVGAVVVGAALLGPVGPVTGQLVSVRTVPLASGDQFLLQPTSRLGMGGVSIAVDDTLGDPFVNPARGARVEGIHLFSSPTYYGITDGLGSGRSLPIGGLGSGRRWFGGGSIALQQLVGSERFRGCCFRIGMADVAPSDVMMSFVAQNDRLSDRTRNNLYLSGVVGRRLGDGRTSVGLSGSYGDLTAMGGVDLLYAQSQRVEQGGSVADVRLGVLRELSDDRTAEFLLLHHRVDMQHDVTYVDWRWDPVQRRSFRRVREERNLDHTRTWGAHLQVRQPLGQQGWRLGWIATGNFKTHPKLPNYEIMNIPRDPGTTWAYNLGLGVSRQNGPAQVALDVVYEPIWSETWAEADTLMRLPGGRTLEVGAHTVDNRFRFNNAVMRMGVRREGSRLGFQLGLQARANRYRLWQEDHVADTQRTQREQWVEWAPSWGATAGFPEFQVRYSGRVTTGTGWPGVAFTGGRLESARALAADFLPAPRGPLTLQEATVWTHQITLRVPVN